MLGVSATRCAAPALPAPCQHMGKAAATRGGLAGDTVSGQGSLLGKAFRGWGGPVQRSHHTLQVVGSPLIRGVPEHLTENIWLESLVLDSLEAWKSLPGGRGSVRIRADMVQASIARLGWFWCHLSLTLQHCFELEKGAAHCRLGWP